MVETTTPQLHRAGRWLRRARRVLGGAVLGACVLVLTADWWLPALLERAVGLEAGGRETRWGKTVEWRDVRWSRGGLKFSADRVRIDAPSRLARALGVVNAQVDGWVLSVGTGTAADGEAQTETMGVAYVRALAVDAGDLLERWGGEIRLRRGRLRVAGEEIEIGEISAIGTQLGGQVAWRGEVAEWLLSLRDVTATVKLPERELSLALGLDPELRASVEITWAGNTARGAAGWGAEGWVPQSFELTGEEWTVEAERLGLPDGQGVLRGGFSIAREGDGLAVSVEAEAQPVRPGLPVVKIVAEGAASLEEVRLERLDVEAPQVFARLSAPLAWRAGAGWVADGEPEFGWRAELGELSGGRLSGRAEGQARLVFDDTKRMVWAAQAEGLQWEDLRVEQATLRGETTTDETRLDRLELRLPGGARVEGGGRYLHASRELVGVAGRVMAPDGADLARWLPAGLRVGAIELDVTVAGPVAQPAFGVRGRVADLAYEEWRVDQIELTASGGDDSEVVVEAMATRGPVARLDVALALSPEGGEAKRFNLRRGDGCEFALVRPAIWRLAEGRRALSAEWAGDDQTLEVSWRERGEADVRIINVDTRWVADWREAEPWPEALVRELVVTGRVDAEGWVAGEGRADVVWPGVGWVRAEGAAGPDGLRLSCLEIGQAEETLAAGTGMVPWRVRAGEWQSPVPIEGGEWSLRVDSRAEATLWDELATVAGLELERPLLALELAGPAREPNGRVALAAKRIVLRADELPPGGLELRGLEAVAEVSAGEIEVRRLSATVDGQRVEAEGRLKLAEGDWARLRERPYAWLRDHAQARLSLPGAEVAALARYLPTLLAPVGTLQAEVRLSPGANLDGRVSLREGATRPLGDFGVLKNIEVDLRLEGMDVRIERMRAMASGQAVEISGGARRDPGKLPALDLKVKAERFPFIRKPGLLLRGDLDLAVRTLEAGRTQVSGTARLRDSLFLSDIRPLIAAGGGSAAAVRARPPYFSVETLPLADWELAVRVEGDSFVRIRTPVFEGLGSARFDLRGTLREPRATGEFLVDRGSILFPFASFAVQEGSVRLLENDPYTPVLDCRAEGRRLGYDLRLELGGTTDMPRLQLFSSPPLDAETLVLMVSAGAAPNDTRSAAKAGQRLAAVGAYFGRDLLRTLGFGGDGADEERLAITSGERVSRHGRETYGFIFRLDDRWSLAGEYDEFDAYNIGIRRTLRGRLPEPTDVPGAARSAGEQKEGCDAR
jgi:translocation and assembly module TamB